MEVKKPYIKSIPYEEWNDNASLGPCELPLVADLRYILLRY